MNLKYNLYFKNNYKFIIYLKVSLFVHWCIFWFAHVGWCRSMLKSETKRKRG